MIRQLPLVSRVTLDVSGAMAGVATFMGYLPIGTGALASVLACIWYVVQLIYFFKNRKKS